LYFFSGLLAPWWAVAILWIVWAVLLRALILGRHQTSTVIAVPFVAYGFWALVILLGDWLLGWTA
jgi:hypothetical protein